MKKILILSTVLLGAASIAQAQSVRFGVKGGAGINLSKTNSVVFDNIDDKLGFNGFAGGFAEISFKKPSDKFKLQVEALYNFGQLNAQYTDRFNTTIDIKNQVHSISVPVLAKYFITPSFSAYLGPAVHFNLASNAKVTGLENEAVSNYLNTVQFGGMLGLNYYVKNGFFVEARYSYVAPDLYSSDYGRSYDGVNNITLGVGYKFARN